MLIRPYAAAGRPWDLVVAASCVVLLVIVFFAEILTPDDVVGALAILPLIVATWVLPSRAASFVMFIGALLFSAVLAVERAHVLTLISIGLATLLTLAVIRLYATTLAQALAGHRHSRRTVSDSVPLAAVAAFDSSDGIWSLTRRELDVARLAAEGYTAAEIGNRLHIGHRTVESHLGSTYSKLHINTKAQLIRMASRLETPLRHDPR